MSSPLSVQTTSTTLTSRDLRALVIWPAVIAITGTVVGLIGTAYTVYEKQVHADKTASHIARQGAYQDFLKLSDTVLNAGNGSAYEQRLRDSLALVQLVGSEAANKDAPRVAADALDGRNAKYNKDRATFLDDARKDVQ